MKITSIAFLTCLNTAFLNTALMAQATSLGSSTTPSVTPTQGITAPPLSGTGVEGNTSALQGQETDAGYTTNQTSNSQNSQAARTNAAQANPGQPTQQNNSGGVFGPSAGPGIFGPAGTQQPQATTVDAYGTRQPSSATSGSSTQNNAGQGSRSPQAATAPITYDAWGNPVQPTNGSAIQNQLPRDLQPISTVPAQPASTNSVTGR